MMETSQIYHATYIIQYKTINCLKIFKKIHRGLYFPLLFCIMYKDSIDYSIKDNAAHSNHDLLSKEV